MSTTKLKGRIPVPRQKSALRQSSKVGQEIIAGMSQMLEAIQNGEPLEKRFTVRRVKSIDPPGKYGPAEVKRLRVTLGASQQVFAWLIGVSRVLVKSWEIGSRTPSELARRLLDEIAANPDRWRARFSEVWGGKG